MAMGQRGWNGQPGGGSIGDAFRNSRRLVQAAESWGYRRYWVAEHHNLDGIASAATVVLMGYLAEATRAIRLLAEARDAHADGRFRLCVTGVLFKENLALFPEFVGFCRVSSFASAARRIVSRSPRRAGA